MRRLIAAMSVGLVLLAAVGVQILDAQPARSARSVPPNPQPAPKLVVLIVVDQMRADCVEKFGPRWTGGLRRLIEEGAWFREAAYRYADEAEGERTPAQWTRTFPHVLKGAGAAPDEQFYNLWIESPFSDAYLGKLAGASIDALKLGQGGGTDYLAVSFSALDFVGHDFGPRSHEVQDVLARLDRTLGSLVAHLDAAVGRDRYVLALTADHGVSPVPEQMAAFGLDAGRVVTPELTARIDKALEPFLGPGRKVARMVYEDLFFAPGVYEKLRGNPQAMQAALDAARSMPGIARVFTADQLASSRGAAGDEIERETAASFFPGRSGDLIVIPRPYYQFAWSASRRSGTTHGSPYWYDRRVPIFLLGQGIRRGYYLTAAEPIDIAPTLAFLCEITLPASDGRVLNEALVGTDTQGSRLLPATPLSHRGSQMSW